MYGGGDSVIITIDQEVAIVFLANTLPYKDISIINKNVSRFEKNELMSYADIFKQYKIHVR
jgi:hypothetical protein